LGPLTEVPDVVEKQIVGAGIEIGEQSSGGALPGALFPGIEAWWQVGYRPLDDPARLARLLRYATRCFAHYAPGSAPRRRPNYGAIR